MQLDLFSAAARSTERRIDRTTDHMCDGLARDIAYVAAQGRSYFRCGDHADIPVHYANFSMICADCRRECLDDSDVADTACAYCAETL
jgi:hypothetical protein